MYSDDIGLFLQQHAYSKTTDPQKVFLLGTKDYNFIVDHNSPFILILDKTVFFDGL